MRRIDIRSLKEGDVFIFEADEARTPYMVVAIHQDFYKIYDIENHRNLGLYTKEYLIYRGPIQYKEKEKDMSPFEKSRIRSRIKDHVKIYEPCRTVHLAKSTIYQDRYCYICIMDRRVWFLYLDKDLKVIEETIQELDTAELDIVELEVI